MTDYITEGKVKINVYKGKVSKKLPVFYNPAMELNRTTSVVLLNSINKKNMQIALPLAASGVRGIRFLKELKKEKIKSLDMNDYSNEALILIKQNLKLNKINTKKVNLHNKDANIFLLESNGFDYIDIDPFGTPNPFLDAAVKRIARDGILAVTATDTSALAGTYPKACKRKYWAKPLRNELKHEIGLRILIRKVQLIGAQYDKSLIPIFSYSKEHYMRVFFKCDKGKKKVDELIKKHDFYEKAGPMWLGQLWDKKLAEKMYKQEKSEFLRTIRDESKIDVVGFYDIHALCKKYKIKQIPKFDVLVRRIKKAGYKVSRTHFKPEGLKSSIPLQKLLQWLDKKR
jgi:tRNA (guanine26-N2/guanine27-N2)-dimethyltransferase